MDLDKPISEPPPASRLIKDYKREAKAILRGAPGYSIPKLKPLAFTPGPTTAQEQLKVAKDAATEVEKQTALLDALSLLAAEQVQTLAALSKASTAQVQTLAAMRQLSEDLAGERRRAKWHEEQQGKFNKRMTVLASVLAGTAVVIPFVILWIEQALG
ncbi:hypothetical protein [Paeniglutamicibacter sp. Y32M11]|uniref:hypothetical protein n=1 Tax=Paeniglutamicibacter sp. Y32M11 TaxID=2853258 RepID=UPI001C53137D|nr:hypothetical protein [Paeniglutamicibacter sp. Y32M11]QXQ11482.1 hypothetical protein KUF55_06250 [Paeniglutamicibacter sp. Y32M11]